MSNIQKVRCWFEVNGVKYGPAVCELTEDVELSARGIETISGHGTFELEPEAESLMFQDHDAVLWLEDGRQADIMITRTTNWRSGSFAVQTDFE